jgi:hypothetical protein
MILRSGLHNPDASHRSRVSYLFSRFIKEVKSDIPADVAVNIASSMRDLLPIEVQIPDAEDSDSSADLLSEAVRSSAFDSQLYLYETLGILCSLLVKTPPELAELLLSFVKPLMSELSDNLQAYRAKGCQDLIPIVKVHHVIMALGNIAKGFPEYPSPVPPDYVPFPVDVFAQVAEAILVCLEAMNVLKDVRDAVKSIFFIRIPRSDVSQDPFCVRSHFGHDRAKRHTFHTTTHDKFAHPVRAFGTGGLYELHRAINPQAASMPALRTSPRHRLMDFFRPTYFPFWMNSLDPSVRTSPVF